MEEIRKAAQAVIDEWNILPKDRAYTIEDVRTWLIDYMGEKINALDAALSALPPAESEVRETCPECGRHRQLALACSGCGHAYKTEKSTPLPSQNEDSAPTSLALDASIAKIEADALWPGTSAPEGKREERSCETCKHFNNPFCLLQKGPKCYDAGYPSWERGGFSIYRKPERSTTP